jgi:hypothetical protein
MTNQELAVAYIKAVEANDMRNEKITAGIAVLCDGHPVMESMAYELYQFYDTAMNQLMGEENFEWCNWYLYDSGDHKIAFKDDKQIIITSPEQLAEIFISQ